MHGWSTTNALLQKLKFQNYNPLLNIHNKPNSQLSVCLLCVWGGVYVCDIIGCQLTLKVVMLAYVGN